MTITSKLALSTAVGALGGLLFGFDTVVISGTTEQLTRVFTLSPTALGQTVSIALWGTVMGALGAGWLGTLLGGRNALRIMALLYIISAIGCAFALNWPMLMMFRFIGGIGIGGSSVLGPVYIAELAPAAWRGRLVGTFQMMVVVGILIAYLSNWYIARLGRGTAEWRWQLGIASIGDPLPCAPVHHSTELTLPHHAEQPERCADRAATDGCGESRGRARRYSPFHSHGKRGEE